VILRQDEGSAKLPAALDDALPEDCVRVAAAHPSTAGLSLFGSLALEKAPAEKAA
jgi:NADH-quinone oxidoreductase subunit G